MALRIKIAPLRTKTPNVVYGGKLSLTKGGGGANPAAKSPVDASIVFVERAAKGDTTKDERHIATLKGTIQLKGKQYVFDANNGLLSGDFDEKSDFELLLDFDAKTFANPPVTNSLFVPWEVAEEGAKIEVGLKLLIDGKLHAPVSKNDSLDVPLKHPSVHEDADQALPKHDFFGIRVVYTSAPEFPISGDKLPIGQDRLRCLLHTSVKDECESARKGLYNLAKIRGYISGIFRDAGFASVDVFECKDHEFYLHHWKRNSSGEIVAKNLKNRSRVSDSEGADVPYFDFWVAKGDATSVGGPAAGAIGEQGHPVDHIRVNVATRTKRLIAPTWFGGPTMQSTLAGASDDDDAMTLLINMLCHELGHSLGLRHALVYAPSSKAYELQPSGGYAPYGLMAYGENSKKLRLFGPVHKALLKKRYL
jgi:hypothetical protein